MLLEADVQMHDELSKLSSLLGDVSAAWHLLYGV